MESKEVSFRKCANFLELRIRSVPGKVVKRINWRRIKELVIIQTEKQHKGTDLSVTKAVSSEDYFKLGTWIRTQLQLVGWGWSWQIFYIWPRWILLNSSRFSNHVISFCIKIRMLSFMRWRTGENIQILSVVFSVCLPACL